MWNITRQAAKHLTLFLLGGAAYYLIEILYSGSSHPAMLVVGGLCFLLVGGLNEVFSWKTPLWLQMLMGALVITAMELVSGCILNLWLGLHIWDYSRYPLNLLGQICLPYTLMWAGLSLVAVVADDLLRFWMWGEERPRYRWRR